MGNDSNKPYLNSKRIYDKSEIVNKNSFEYLSIIGKGGFGKVWKVLMHKTQKQYALKEMSKAKIIDKRSENSIKFERDLLSRINHPYIYHINTYYIS
jgi:serine/threonine kinase 32